MAETKMSTSTLAAIMIVVVLVVGAGSFWGGMKYQVFKQKSMFAGGPTGQMGDRTFGGNGNGNNRNGVTMINGEIISRDEASITVKDKSGSSKIILLSDSTEVGKFVNGEVADLSVGSSVMINGKTNSDKSVTATSVQIRPAGETVPPEVVPSQVAPAETTTK